MNVGRKPRPTSGAAVLLVGIALLVVVLLLGTEYGQPLLTPVGFAVGMTPMLIHLGVCRATNRRSSELQPATLFATTGATLLTAGWLSHMANGATIRYILYGRLDVSSSFSVLVKLALATSLLVLGAHLVPPNRVRLNRRGEPAVHLYLTLGALALLGSVLTILQLGGIQAATDVLASHDRSSRTLQAGVLGPRLWTTFSVPALTGVGVLAARPGPARSRLLAGAAFVTLAGLAITVYGSRLTVVLAAIAILAILQRHYDMRLSARGGLIGVLIFIALSSYVLGNRAELQGQAGREGGSVVVRVLDTLSYGVYDVALAISLRPTALDSAFDLQRNLVLLESTAPSPLGPNPEALERARLDSIVGDAVGRSTDIGRTGLPPSLPVALALALPAWVLPLAALLIGGAFALLFRVVSNFRGAAATLVTGLVVSFSFNAFKSGDVLLDLAGQARTVAYIVVLGWVLRFFLRLNAPNSTVDDLLPTMMRAQGARRLRSAVLAPRRRPWLENRTSMQERDVRGVRR